MGKMQMEFGGVNETWEPDPHIDLETAVFRYRGQTGLGKRLAELLGLAPCERADPTPQDRGRKDA